MQFIHADMKFLPQAVALAQEQFRTESLSCPTLRQLDIGQALAQNVKALFEGARGGLLVEGETLMGYLLPDGFWEGTVYSRPCGYGARGDRMRVLSLLFQNVAREQVAQGVHRFEFKVYAHDEQAIRALALEEFGMQCADCIRPADRPVLPAYDGGVTLRHLPRKEALARQEELLPLWRALVEHLRKSPVFYFGAEFTDEAYLGLIDDENVRLYVAEDGGRIVGLIDGNPDGNCAVNQAEDCLNIGDVYVLPEYRGTGLAQGLLALAAQDLAQNAGARTLWVMHGTANPNARHYWDRLFDVYAYSMARDIDPRMVGR